MLFYSHSRYASLLFHRGSLFNHDCDPNARREILENPDFEDGSEVYKISLRITAVRTIQPEESITISYIDCEQTYETRQKILIDVFYFKCCCERCLKESSGSDK